LAQEAERLEVPHVRQHASAGDVVRVGIARSVKRLLDHEQGVRRGDDIESVHKARVATRRLRSDFRTFRALVDEHWGAELRDQLKWAADLLGAVRDRDVLLERLSRQAAGVPPMDRHAGRSLLVRLEDEQADARRALLSAMDSRQYVDLVESLLAAAASPVLTPEADQPARPVIAAEVRKSLKHVDEAVSALAMPPTDEELHNVRIRAKRARYAAEAARPVWGKPAKRLASAMADVQSVLGDLQDAAVAEQWLRRAGRASVAQSFLAGELVAMQRVSMASARDAFGPVWKNAAAPKLRSWLH
jgi:CHAD domain-containing protein